VIREADDAMYADKVRRRKRPRQEP
jgi:hypothetical protein